MSDGDHCECHEQLCDAGRAKLIAAGRDQGLEGAAVLLVDGARAARSSFDAEQGRGKHEAASLFMVIADVCTKMAGAVRALKGKP